MVTPELTATRSLTRASTIVLTLTATGILAGLTAPALAGTIAPHPTMHGTISEAVGILINNLRVMLLPFGLAILPSGRNQRLRHSADLLLLLSTAANVLPVGIALGHWRTQLLPYLPHLPIEWAALAVAISAWLLARDHPINRETLATLALTCATLLTLAAAIETWATPQAISTPRQQTHSLITSHPKGFAQGRAGPGAVADALIVAPNRPGRHQPTRPRSLTPPSTPRPEHGADRALPTTPKPPPGGSK